MSLILYNTTGRLTDSLIIHKECSSLLLVVGRPNDALQIKCAVNFEQHTSAGAGTKAILIIKLLVPQYLDKYSSLVISPDLFK